MLEKSIRFKGKIIGILKGKTYISEREPEHFFIKFNGFGLSYSIMEELKGYGCENVVIIYHRKDGSQTLYRTSLDRFYKAGIVWLDGNNDYQRILPLSEFYEDKVIIE